jgi:predicted transcriptional regulator
MSDLVKLSVNLPEEDVAWLKAVAERRSTTVTHVLRQAIASEKFFAAQLSVGGQVLIKMGRVCREVVFR